MRVVSQDGSITKQVTVDDSGIASTWFSSDYKNILVESTSGKLYLCHLGREKSILVVDTETTSILGVAPFLLSEGTITLDSNGFVHIWDNEKQHIVKTTSVGIPSDAHPTCMAFSPIPQLLSVGYSTGFVHVYALNISDADEPLSLLFESKGHNGIVKKVQYY